MSQRFTVNGGFDPTTGAVQYPLPVSGTLTTTPSGTQDVNIVGPSPVVVDGLVGTYSSVDPTWTGVYVEGLTDAAGTVAANNYISVFNPVGSGVAMIAISAIVGSYSTGSVTGVSSLSIFRTTAASAGTLIAPSAVNRFATTMPDPVTELRVGNPTVTTVGRNLIGFPPVIGGTAGTVASVVSQATAVVLPGEGLVFRVPNGDVQQLWDIQFAWAEKPL